MSVGSDSRRYRTDAERLAVAAEQARTALDEGGVPVGAALFDEDGRLLGAGRNRRVQHDDPSVHGETDAFRAAGRQRSYRSVTLATTLAPCWYCSGLIRQFGIGRLLVGDDVNFAGGRDWVAEHGTEVVVVNDPDLIAMMGGFIRDFPALWNEDIGEE